MSKHIGFNLNVEEFPYLPEAQKQPEPTWAEDDSEDHLKDLDGVLFISTKKGFTLKYLDTMSSNTLNTSQVTNQCQMSKVIGKVQVTCLVKVHVMVMVKLVLVSILIS